MVTMVIILSVLFITIPIITILYWLRKYKQRVRHAKQTARQSENAASASNSSPSIGFLHPHALSGGGGERVLWSAIAAVRSAHPTSRIVLYNAWRAAGAGGSSTEGSSIQREAIERAEKHFGLDLQHVGEDFEMVDISDVSHYVDPQQYPRLTLVRQAIGMIRLGIEAYARRPTDVMIDTANLTFSLFLPKVIAQFVITVSYVHYPTISTDMLNIVKNQQVDVHNDAQLAKSKWKTLIKLEYYRVFAYFYKIIGNSAVDIVMANSTWTATHLMTIWNRNKEDIPIVYPPCPMTQIENNDGKDGNMIVSVGQFRSEKRHDEQVKIMKRVVQRHPHAKLYMIGGVRNDEDKARVAYIRNKIDTSGLSQNIQLCVNVDRNELEQLIHKASVGLHTMRYEHFGISVVELMSAGVIVVGHGSGGVADDIIDDGVNGMLSENEEEFVERICQVVEMDEEKRREMSTKASKSSKRYSDGAFQESFSSHIEKCFRY